MLGFGPRKGRRRTPGQIKIEETLQHWRPSLFGAARVSLVLLVGAALLWGLQQAQSQADLWPSHQQNARFDLVNAPRALRDVVLCDLRPLTQVTWNDPSLCHQVYLRLLQNGWVRSVKQVAKGQPGQIVVDCDYRTPVALVQIQEYCYLLDEQGVRLPGTYDYQPGWLLIKGLKDDAPQPGQIWSGEDAATAVSLAKLIRAEPFARQVASVIMSNYGGRIDPYAPHVELETEGRSGRILWGSAPGHELEENTAAQKLHILSENYRRYGRIDANHAKIDVSVFPDRFLIPP